MPSTTISLALPARGHRPARPPSTRRSDADGPPGRRRRAPLPSALRSGRGALVALAAVVAAVALPAAADAAVTAHFKPGAHTLSVFGDSSDNTITLTRSAAGRIIVNGDAVAVKGATPTVANTDVIEVFADDGDDSVSLDETAGPLPLGWLLGGEGDDLLVGGSRADHLFGQSGDDTVDGRGADDIVNLGEDDDTAVWRAGDGQDIVNGSTDRDRLQLIGSGVDDRFSIRAGEGTIRALHGASGVELQPFGFEDATISARGGADTIDIGALNDTELRTVTFDLAATAGSAAGDGERDAIAIAGGDGRADTMTLTAAGTPPAPNGHTFAVHGGDGALDTVDISTHAGFDLVDASALPAGQAAVTLRGGVDRDVLIGSAGNDVIDAAGGDDLLRGGGGDDTLRAGTGIDELDGGDGRDDLDPGTGEDTATGGAGDDTFRWQAGDGSDRLDGGSGRDELRFAGNGANESFEVQANADRVRLTRNVANIAIDLGELEELRLSAAGGDDDVTVGDTTGTALALAAIDLAAQPNGGTGDARADTVRVTGTTGPNAVEVRNATGGATVTGLRTFVQLAGADIGSDRVAIDALSGNDTVAAPGVTMPLSIDGGAGNDTLAGGALDDTLTGGEGDDTFHWTPLDGGNDRFDGDADSDRLRVEGNGANEELDLRASAGRLRLFRNVGNKTLDAGSTETVDLQPLGGADRAIVHDLTGSGITDVGLDLAGAGAAEGDGAADAVIVEGTAGLDDITVAGITGEATVSGLAARTAIRAAEPGRDTLRIDALGQDDIVRAQQLAGGMTIDGDDGDNVLLGSLGNDHLLGGLGDDVLDGGPGTDVLDGGPGTDFGFNGETLIGIP